MTRTLEELCEYLVGHWKFDNNFLDSSGNGNHGTPVNIEWKPTARGLKPYNLQQTGQVNCGSDSSLDVSGNVPFTISFYSEFISDEDQIFCAAGFALASSTDGFAISSGDNGKIYFDTDDGTARRILNKYIDDGVHHIVVTWDGYGEGKIYSDGILLTESNDLAPSLAAQIDFEIFSDKTNPPWNVPKWMDDVRFYKNVIFAPDEVLALYESTKHAYGVRPAERSFTHRLQPEVDANTVAAFDMSTKNSDGTLMDLSGNSNHGDIYGAVRAGGYFTDGMRFDGVDDYINIDPNVMDGATQGCITFLINKDNWLNDWEGFVCKFNGGSWPNNHIKIGRFLDEDNIAMSLADNTYYKFCKLTFTPDSKYHIFDMTWDNDTIYGYMDGVLVSTVEHNIILPSNSTNFKIFYGEASGRASSGENILTSISNVFCTESQIKSRFNSLAKLPLYTFDASKYPTSSGWTANVPYSSMSISSGEFSFTDDGQLQCDSAGSFSLRNAHEFDGDEYIKLTINDTEYAGTGSVTEGNVTVSLTQGSNKISVNMGAGDVIDCIDIQFREPVEV